MSAIVKACGGAKAYLREKTQVPFRALLWAVCWVACAAPVHAQHAQPAPSAAQAPEPEASSRVTLGLSAFGALILSEEKPVGGGGGSFLAALTLVPERWEIELGLSLAKPHDADPLGVFEVIGKRIFERRGPWSPHLLFGPLVSLDFGHETSGAGGLVVGGGVTHWLGARFGLCAEGAYRLLIGSDVEQLLTTSLGIRARI